MIYFYQNLIFSAYQLYCRIELKFTTVFHKLFSKLGYY